MRFELITVNPIDTQWLYEATHIQALQIGDNRYSISDDDAETHRNVQELERYIQHILRDLKVAYVSLTLLSAERMVELQPP